MNIRKDLFRIFQENKDSYDLYEKTVKFIAEVIEDTKGEENAQFYNYVIKLLDSINNAGWENRRSEQIKLLHNIQSQIVNKYEDYLP